MSTEYEPESTHHPIGGRQRAVIIVGSLVVLCVTFALGAQFGKAVASRTVQVSVDLARLDAQERCAKLAVPALAQEAQPPAQPPAAENAPAPTAEPAAPVEAAAQPAAEQPAPAAEPSAPAGPSAAKEAAPAGSESTRRPMPQRPSSEWGVQFGSLSSRPEADRLSAAVRKAGYTAYIQVADLPRKGRFYRVRVGRFGKREQAQSLRDEAESRHHLSGIVAASP